MIFMERRIKMATRKKKSEENDAAEEQARKEEEARIEHTNKMINNAFENGKKEGQQEVWKAVSKFLKERMLAHFMNKNNEIAKELRDINEIISKNIA